MILFFDVETTGLPDYKKRASDPSQPHLVEVAAILEDQGKPIESINFIVKPEGWIIPAQAAETHGITTAQALRDGQSEEYVISLLFDLISKAKLIVAHNMMFDKFMTRIALRRYGLLTDDMDDWWKGLPTFCTMREMTDICMLPGRHPGQFKYPKLSEAYEHALGKPLNIAHEAMADTIACKEIFYWLLGKYPGLAK